MSVVSKPPIIEELRKRSSQNDNDQEGIFNMPITYIPNATEPKPSWRFEDEAGRGVTIFADGVVIVDAGIQISDASALFWSKVAGDAPDNEMNRLRNTVDELKRQLKEMEDKLLSARTEFTCVQNALNQSRYQHNVLVSRLRDLIGYQKDGS